MFIPSHQVLVGLGAVILGLFTFLAPEAWSLRQFVYRVPNNPDTPVYVPVNTATASPETPYVFASTTLDATDTSSSYLAATILNVILKNPSTTCAATSKSIDGVVDQDMGVIQLHNTSDATSRALDFVSAESVNTSDYGWLRGFLDLSYQHRDAFTRSNFNLISCSSFWKAVLFNLYCSVSICLFRALYIKGQAAESLKTIIAAAQRDNRHLQQVISVCDATIQQLHATNVDLLQVNSVLNLQTSNWQKQFGQSRETISKLTEDTQFLHTQNKDQESIFLGLQTDIESYKAHLKDMQEITTKSGCENASLMTQLANTNGKCLLLEEENDTLKRKDATSAKVHTKLTNQTISLNQQNQLERIHKKEAQAQLRQEQESSSGLRKENSSLKGRLSKSHAIKDDLKAQLDEERQAKSSVLQGNITLKAQLAQSQETDELNFERISILTKDNESLYEERAILEQHNNEISEKDLAQQTKIQDILHQYEELREEREILVKDMQALSDAQLTLTDDLLVSRQQNVTLHEQLELVQDQYAEKSAMVGELEEKNSDLAHELSSAREKCNAQSVQIEVLEDTIKEIGTEHASEENRANEAECRASDSIQAANHLREELATAQNALSESRTVGENSNSPSTTSSTRSRTHGSPSSPTETEPSTDSATSVTWSSSDVNPVADTASPSEAQTEHQDRIPRDGDEDAKKARKPRKNPTRRGGKVAKRKLEKWEAQARIDAIINQPPAPPMSRYEVQQTYWCTFCQMQGHSDERCLALHPERYRDG